MDLPHTIEVAFLIKWSLWLSFYLFFIHLDILIINSHSVAGHKTILHNTMLCTTWDFVQVATSTTLLYKLQLVWSACTSCNLYKFICTSCNLYKFRACTSCNLYKAYTLAKKVEVAWLFLTIFDTIWVPVSIINFTTLLGCQVVLEIS